MTVPTWKQAWARAGVSAIALAGLVRAPPQPATLRMIAREIPHDAICHAVNSSDRMLPARKCAKDDALQLIEQPRSKKWAPKVRTGCITCRGRRVKCDEQKPSCQRCAKAGFYCQGYYPSPLESSSILSLSPAPTHVQPTASEMELNAYFRSELAPTIFDEFSHDMWKIHIPQSARNDASIWHACNAIAAACRRRRIRQSASSSDQLLGRTLSEEGFKQTAASLKSIAKSTSKPNLSRSEKSNILAASLLLSYWYSRIDDTATDEAMVSYIIKLFQHWKFWHDEQSGPIPSRDVLFFVIKTDRTMADSALLTEEKPWHWKDALKAMQSQPIRCSRDASIELEMIWGGLQCLLWKVPLRQSDVAAAVAGRIIFRQCLKMFKERFGAFCTSSCSDQERIRIKIIQVRQLLVEILLAVDLTEGELCWDRCHDSFACATSKVELLLGEKEYSKFLPESTPMLAKSLSWMGKVCREPTLRRRIASLLYRRVEVMYNLFATKRPYHFPFTDILNSVMAAEEGCWDRLSGGKELDEECSSPCCVRDKFICNNHRITELSLNPDPANPRDDLLTMRTVSDVLNDRPGRTQYVVALVWS